MEEELKKFFEEVSEDEELAILFTQCKSPEECAVLLGPRLSECCTEEEIEVLSREVFSQLAALKAEQLAAASGGARNRRKTPDPVDPFTNKTNAVGNLLTSGVTTALNGFTAVTASKRADAAEARVAENDKKQFAMDIAKNLMADAKERGEPLTFMEAYTQALTMA
jgi:hypothetical protein